MNNLKTHKNIKHYHLEIKSLTFGLKIKFKNVENDSNNKMY